MSILFLQYPPCSTCKNAKKWLDAHDVAYDARNIKEENPNSAELADWIQKSGLPIKRFFNTSGIIYKEKNLKELLPGMSEKEQIDLLATDGMLVKRPLIIGDDFVLVGFKEKEWESSLLR
ncbi:arsenate reductase family protein [Lacrimispora sp.]|jgi:arsenate reductase|uniref:arsenate reductase family protein n=1 Tax=Lacrimispora sp. TaxID=2719234 RepID=UPI0028672FB0|nr:arsenate reductase family protein [Lacrimispora sp.]MDR7814676.1 arsenate reductase family protein [Lacrimispora sp.]